MILDIDRTITSSTLENLIGKRLSCKNLFVDTLVVQVRKDSLIMYQSHELTKQMDPTLRNGKTAG